jgi:hypothetical protein
VPYDEADGAEEGRIASSISGVGGDVGLGSSERVVNHQGHFVGDGADEGVEGGVENSAVERESTRNADVV